jgi:hypothetical protein
MRGGGSGIDAIENFDQRGAVPGFAIECAVQLVGYQFDFEHMFFVGAQRL